ncbi:hypothetical protein EV127DRAFT_408386 [Xylaria flabelliformis]|nr:hypothetical protein EV127DRAFT_408386 [Xylaria flabelliformis]
MVGLLRQYVLDRRPLLLSVAIVWWLTMERDRHAVKCASLWVGCIPGQPDPRAQSTRISMCRALKLEGNKLFDPAQRGIALSAKRDVTISLVVMAIVQVSGVGSTVP